MAATMERRKFLAQMAQTAAGAAMLPEFLSAQTSATAVKHVAPAKPVPAVMLNVREAPFSAKGDGTTKDTAAFQAALDRCGVMGGGEVLVPAGNYLVGSLQLRSKTTLRFAEGAVLMGSPAMGDYAVTQVRWEGPMDCRAHRAGVCD